VNKVFFIGMNRIATKSFSHLFKDSGYRSFHYSCMDTMTGQSIILAQQMQNNLDEFRPVMHGMDKAHVYSDMFWHRENVWIDGVKMYREIQNQHPDAYFILQTRDMDAWLLSKENHKGGAYIKRCMDFHGVNQQEMIDWFKYDREKHEKAVRKHFLGYDKFLEYDLDNDPITKLIDFLKPEFFLQEKYWGHYK